MDPFEHDVRDELRRAAQRAPATLPLQAVYARAAHLHRAQTARTTLASAGALAVLAWTLYAATGHPLGAARLTPAGTPTESATPSATASSLLPDAVVPTALPVSGAPAPTPSETADLAGSPSPDDIPTSGPDDPFDPAVDSPPNGPATPLTDTRQSADAAKQGYTVVHVDAHDPDGWVREITFEYTDVNDPAGGSTTFEFTCDPDAPDPAGTAQSASKSVDFATPGDHDVTVTVTSASCDDPYSDAQTATTTVTVTTPAPGPALQPRKDLS